MREELRLGHVSGGGARLLDLINLPTLNINGMALKRWLPSWQWNNGRMSVGLEIRTATAEDASAIIPIVNEAFAIETFLDGTRTDVSRLAEMMKKGTFLVGERGGKIVASVYVELHGERGYFGMLAVDPSQQGKGLGGAMIEAAEQYCRGRGCRDMDITVLSLRPELPPFYRKYGYVETGTEEFRPSRPLKAGANCHCIRMSKKFD